MTHHPLIIAHRGASEEAEENSLAAFLLAAKQGADMIEMDLRVTKDQMLVLNHNDRLKRLSPHLKVSTKTYDELLQEGIELPKLADVIDALPEHILINLDLKSNIMDLALRQLIHNKKIEKRVFFDTNSWFVLQRYQLFFPNANFVLNNSTSLDPFNISATVIGRGARFLLSILLFLPLRFLFRRKLHKVETQYVALYYRLCNKADVDLFHSLGIKVLIFTINKEKNLRKFIKMGVDGIKTNKPDLLYKIIHEIENTT